MTLVPTFDIYRSRWGPLEDPDREKLAPEFFSAPAAPLRRPPVVDRRTGSAVWTEGGLYERGFSALGYLAPASTDRLSEDAPPLFCSVVDGHVRSIAAGVFDGMGGAGSQLTSEVRGHELSQAYLASRLARRVVETSFWERGELFWSKTDAEQLLSSEFQAVGKELREKSGTKMRGSMVKTLPTTLAVAMCASRSSDEWSIKVQWSGDSRAFLITPAVGLQQLTRDDVACDDILEQLRNDQSLTNVVNGSSQFFINERTLHVEGPAILLMATDGMFHYLPTPGVLEEIVLRSIGSSERDMATRLGTLSSLRSHDDVSFVAVILGVASHKQLEDAFFRRREELAARNYGRLLRTDLDAELRAALVDEMWQIERDSYMGMLI